MNDEGLELLKEFVEVPPDHDHVATWCRYCRCVDDEPHEPDCLWSRARAYLRDQGVEVKDNE